MFTCRHTDSALAQGDIVGIYGGVLSEKQPGVDRFAMDIKSSIRGETLELSSEVGLCLTLTATVYLTLTVTVMVTTTATVAESVS